ncbi:rRNA maturation RNase YbeY [Treponema sp.]|uniref:rRNA maturation RNase YbeY n=1 Tax=Treponema sp. TaxID=166 RepID=UPI003FA22FE2
MNTIGVAWQDIPEPKWGTAVEPFLHTVLAQLEHSNWDLSVVFCNDAFIHELNKTYRHIDSATDVLSFEQGDEYDDEDGSLRFNAGDIVISLDSLRSNAENFNVTMNEELKRLLVHGILHLSGMDHSDNDPQQPMLQLQEKILGSYTDAIIYQE